MAQAGYLPVSMPSVMLTAYDKNGADVAGVFCNQAALANISSTAAAFFTENRYLMDDQQFFMAAMYHPHALGNAGVMIRQEYSGEWRRTAVAIALARRLTARISAGIQFNACRERAGRYEARSEMTAEAGFIFHVTDQLTAGFHLADPFAFLSDGKKNIAFPATLSAGIGYEAAETFFISTVMRCEKDKEMEMTGGFEYRHMRRFFLRAGFCSGNDIFFMGAGISYRSSRWDFSMSVHPRLGISSGLSWTWRIKQ